MSTEQINNEEKLFSGILRLNAKVFGLVLGIMLMGKI